MDTGLSNLIDKLKPDLLRKLGENKSPYYDAKPFIIPRDEDGNIIEFEQPDPKPFMIPRDEDGNIIEFDPNEGIQLLGSEETEDEYGGTINGIPTTKEGVTAYTEKFLDLNDEGKKMFYLYKEKYPDKDINVVLDVILSKPEFVRTDMIEEEKQIRQKATGGIMALRRGGKANKKTKKEKKEATARYNKVKKAGKAARARYQDDQRESYQQKSRQDRFEKSQSDKSFLKEMEDLNRKRIVDSASTGNVDKSDFTGYKDGLFGLRAGNFKDTGQWILNPETGNKVFIGKARQGLDSSQYSDWVDKNLGRKGSNSEAYRAFQDKFGFGEKLGKIAQLAVPAPIRWGLGALRNIGKLKPVKNLRTMAGDFRDVGANALRTAGKFGPVKDATNMAKDLAGMFGLDGLMGNLVNIAGGRDNNQFNEVIKNNQTSTAMRNNLAYGDPRGLNNEPFYKDEILRNLQNQVRKNTLDPYGVPNPAFGTDQLDIFDIPLNDEVDESYGNTIYDPRDAEKGHNYNVGKPISMGALDTEEPLSITYDENINERWKKLFPDVSETKYVDPNDVIKQENINTGFSDIPLVDPSGVYTDGTPMYAEDQTDIFNAGSFPEMNIFGNEVGGPRHHLLNQINKLGNADSASEKKAKAILNSLGQADGGYMSNFPNQNMGTQSLTASDNIDDRIMKNLQFEKMAPGMMGYNQGGKVMSTFEKLKAIADNNYG